MMEVAPVQGNAKLLEHLQDFSKSTLNLDLFARLEKNAFQ